MDLVDPLLVPILDKKAKEVRTKDKDWVAIIDGEEGSGKSVLAMQLAKHLDPNFNLDNIAFNADQFIEKIKNAKKCSCIVLDEAFSSANSRASLTEVNRSMIGLATEMRQKNLFVLIVLPTFFDLDKYFSLWRCRALFHVYFRPDGSRGRYVVYPKTAKKFLYLYGKKTYDYTKWKSPYPPLSFTGKYVVSEAQYRKLKAEAFKKRTESNLAKRWKQQRDALINELYHNKETATSEIVKIFVRWGKKPISMREIQRIVQLYGNNNLNNGGV